MPAPRREVAGDVAERLPGALISMWTIGSRTIGPGRAHRGEERLAAGGDEGDLLAVDAVVLAVVDDAAHVDDLVPGDRALREHLAHALLDRGDELAGDRAALDLVDELEAEPRGSGSMRRYTSPNWPRRRSASCAGGGLRRAR
jgi:hypothetical protein